MFGSLFQPIPILDIPYAVMNRKVYEGVLPPVMLGGWSSLFLLRLVVIFWESGRWIIPTCTETQNNQQTKIMAEDYFPVSCDRSTDQGCAGLGPCFYYG